VIDGRCESGEGLLLKIRYEKARSSATAAPIATATTAVALHGRHQSTLTLFFATLPPANPFAAARPIAGEAAGEVASGTLRIRLSRILEIFTSS
jgi:hypothetical protein